MVARHEKLRVKENSDELNKMCDFYLWDLSD